jgi:hypothetical protein
VYFLIFYQNLHCEMEKEFVDSIEVIQDFTKHDKLWKGYKINLRNKKSHCIVLEQSSQNNLMCSYDNLEKLVGAYIISIHQWIMLGSKITEDELPFWGRMAVHTSKGSFEFYTVDQDGKYSKDDVVEDFIC